MQYLYQVKVSFSSILWNIRNGKKRGATGLVRSLLDQGLVPVWPKNGNADGNVIDELEQSGDRNGARGFSWKVKDERIDIVESVLDAHAAQRANGNGNGKQGVAMPMCTAFVRDTVDACMVDADEVLNVGMTSAGKLKLKILKFSVDWSPTSFRIFEAIRVTYPLHIADDNSLDNFAAYTERSAANALHGQLHAGLTVGNAMSAKSV